MIPPEEISRLAGGLSDEDRRGVLAGDVQAMGALPWCGCDFRAHGGWAWCRNAGDQCLGLALRAHLKDQSS